MDMVYVIKIVYIHNKKFRFFQSQQPYSFTVTLKPKWKQNIIVY